MRISTKGRYALLLLLDLAERRNAGFVSLKEIARRQNISKQYLEQIVSLLHTSGILRANRGKQGGYMLARDPSECTVREILCTTEGSLAPVPCLDDEANQCAQVAFCKTLPLWEGLKKTVADYLDGITLQDILEKSREQDVGSYVI